jgi:hypothetical protein
LLFFFSSYFYLSIYDHFFKQHRRNLSKDTSLAVPIVRVTSGASLTSVVPQNNNPISNPAASSVPNIPTSTANSARGFRPSIATKLRPDGTSYRPITPLEALYYHERLDLVTHPLIKGR